MLVSPLLRFLEKLYSLFVKIGSNLQSLLLLYMRLTWGHQLFLAGLTKLKDIPGTVQFFTKLNLPSPEFHAYEVGITELICGILLSIGFASRLAAIPTIIIMSIALGTAHAEYLANFRFIKEPLTLVIQQPYPFLITGLMVLVFGPGRVSIDAWIKRWICNQPRY